MAHALFTMNALGTLIVYLPKARTIINTIIIMKTINVLILIALVVSTSSAFGRIGETRPEIDKRYGEGKRSDYQRLEGTETIKYRFNDMDIEVVFHDNKSVWEIFHQGHLVGTSDIKLLLKANSDEKRSWHYDGLSHQWISSGESKYVGYLWRGHEDYFCIEDVKACEAIQNSDASDLKGF